MTLRIYLFGQPRLLHNDQPIKWNAPPKTLPMLGYLLLHRGETLQRQQVSYVLWPDEPEGSARANLRRHIHYLQKALPQCDSSPPWLLTDSTSVGWNPRANYWLDVAAFEDLCAQPDQISEAVALYNGDLLETLYDDWVFFDRERLRNLYFDTLTQQVYEYRTRRNDAKATAFAQLVLARDPFREDILRTLMAVRYGAGDRAGALQAYDCFQQRLRHEMGAAPMPETQALYAAILKNGALPAEPAPAGRVAAVDQTAEAQPVVVQPPVASRFLPFAGRAAEVDHLRACWDRARSGQGTLALVGGEAGVGKSRLASELALQVECQGGRVLKGWTAPEEPRAYQAVVRALQAAFPLVAAIELDPVDSAILAMLLPELAGLPLTQRSLARLPRLTPEQEQTRLFDAVAKCLEQLARPRPLLLILEDLHWASENTLALIEFLARRAARHPILILGTYREEETPRTHPLRALRRQLQEEALVEHLALRRLSEMEVANLLARLGETYSLPCPSQEGLLPVLYRESEGNPLFIDLLLQDWQEYAGQPGERLPLTGGVRAAVSQRLAHLSDDVRAYAEVAAILGMAFHNEVVREVGAWSEAQAQRCSHMLLDLRLMHEAEGRSRFDYAFAHHLFQSALYEETPAEKRKRRHFRAAEVLEEIYAPKKAEWCGELAHHYDLGGSPENAVTYYLLTTRQRLAVFADAPALAAVNRALALLDETPIIDPVLEFDALSLREGILDRLGKRQEQQADLRRMELLARAMNDDEKLCTMLLRKIYYLRIVEDRSAEWQALQALNEKVQEMDSPLWQAHVNLAKGGYHVLIHDNAASTEALLKALVIYQKLNHLPGQVECYYRLAYGAIQVRNQAEAGRWIDRALELCDESEGNYELLQVLWVASANQYMNYQQEESIRLSQKLLETARRFGAHLWEGHAHRLMGLASTNLFEIGKAREHLSRAMTVYQQYHYLKGQALTLESMASLADVVGRYEECLQYYRQSLDLYEKLADRQNLCSGNINLAYIYSILQRYDTQKEHAARALALARTIENSFLEAHALTHLGQAESHTGDLLQAKTDLLTALDLFQQIDRPAESIGTMVDLSRVYLALGEDEAANATAEELWRLYQQTKGNKDNDVSCLWAIIHIYACSGKAEQARQVHAEAYPYLQEKIASIPDPESRESFLRIPHVQSILNFDPAGG